MRQGAVLVARIVDHGFVYPPGIPGPKSTDGWQFRLLYLPGLVSPLQYFLVSVGNEANASAQREILVVIGAHGVADAQELESNTAALVAHFPEQILVFVRESSTGWARVSCAQPAGHDAVAAAGATVMASAGWDESSPIVIEVGTHRFDVFMEFREERWRARVQPSR